MKTTHHVVLDIPTSHRLEIIDITPRLRAALATHGLREGLMHITALHTTVALVINENERRLLADMAHHFLGLASPRARWLHDDIHLRDCPPDEPKNAHAHLIAMTLGCQQTLSVHDGDLVLGRWQSLLMVELDGPRQRRVALHMLAAD